MSQDVQHVSNSQSRDAASKPFGFWESLKNLKLIHLQVGLWKWILRDDHDLVLGNNEPHFTLILLFHEHSQQYLCRVLGRTWQRGICRDFRDLYQKCEEFFAQRSCVGYAPLDCESFPVGCKFSKDCQILLPGLPEDGPKEWICHSCLKDFNNTLSKDDPEDLKDLAVKDEEASVGSEKFLSSDLIENEGNDVWKEEDWTEEDQLLDEAPLKKPRSKRSKVNYFFKVEKTSKEWTCNMCGQVFSAAKRYYHLKSKHFVGNFSCSQCEQIFDLAKNLTDHVVSEHGTDIQIYCPSCDKSFAANQTDQGLEAHYRVCINEKKAKSSSELFQCEECGKNFKHRCGYKHHLNVHMPRRFKCQLCDYGAKTKGNLKLHQRVHETGRECICPLCGKSYKHKMSLQQHMNFMHSDSTTQLPCEKCGRQFSCKSSLQKHINRAHSDLFKCHLCSYRGGGNHDLGEHLRTHEEASIVCQTCGLKVKTKRILLKHLRVHTGETPFKCHVCGKAFKSSSPFYYHMKHVHQTVGKILGSKSVDVGVDINEQVP
ncbi:zinc finger protein 845-like [Tigriopus californicus]|uniref:zinc finger protein 845-like n=1 Tax=Tigriopus californicus TaxID=6832 RepID=UPI0027DA7A0C|nr:zinc finger protein 845-like [Tigriopus californicus]